MICEWNELVECGVYLPFMVIMTETLIHGRTKIEKRDSYSWTEGVHKKQYISI